MAAAEFGDTLTPARGGLALPWEHEIKLTPLAFPACARDRAAVRHHNLPRDGQAESGAGALVLIRRPIESIENPADTFRGDAGTLIAHAKPDEAALFRRSTQGDETACGSVFRRVGQKIHEDVPDPRFIHVERRATELRRDHDREPLPGAVNERVSLTRDAAQQGGDADFTALQRRGAAFEAR